MASQYANSANLDARVALHARFSDSTVDWFSWVAGHLALSSADRVLEVGAGNGLLWDRITRVPSLRVLSDLSAGMVSGLAGLALQADVQRLPFPDRTFSVVIANHMLYHVPNIEAAVAECARVLVPGGRLLASTVGEGHMAEIEGLMGAPTTWSFTRENGGDLLNERFDVRVERFPDGLSITEPMAVVNYLRSYRDGTEWVSGVLDGVGSVIERDGVFRVAKSVGLFVGQKRANPVT